MGIFLPVGVAFAQPAQMEDTGESSAVKTALAEPEQDIVVTGSRISRPGLTAPTPVTSVNSEQLAIAAPTTISAGLAQLPQFRASSRAETGVTSANTNAGASQLNLRNLGVNRNLVLLDGQRIVPSTITYAVNIDTLPEPLIRSVEIVTGGASAAYGSDAVAGVVNFIVDDRFEGIKGSVQGSISDIGDVPSAKVSLAVGDALTDSLRFVASADFFYRDGLGHNDRDRRAWSARDPYRQPNVPATATPNFLIIKDDVNIANATFGGLIPSGALRGIAFGPGGQRTDFAFGTLLNASTMVGGVGADPVGKVPLAGALKRASFFGRIVYEAPDGGPTIFFDANYGHADMSQDLLNSQSRGTEQLTIFVDNPFIPSDVRALAQAANLTSFPLGKSYNDYARYKNTVDLYRFSLNIEGDLGTKWKYDAYGTYGKTSTYQTFSPNYLNRQRFYAAIDSVRDPATGQIVCRSTLFGSNMGCVPYNPFGPNSYSREAFEYVTNPQQWRDTKISQAAAAANVQGELFSLWADQPVAMATGVEYRRETIEQVVADANVAVIDFTNIRGAPAAFNGQDNPYFIGNSKPIAKQALNVKEAYIEVDAPIVSDRPGFALLSLNGAVRFTDYSSSGGVTTWKVGLTYKPFDDLRLRVTQSRDIRAANLAELYSGRVQTRAQVRDPATGLTQQSNNFSAGNPDLQPERANSFTAGFVYTPSWLPNFNLSVDAYRIDIKDAVSVLTAQMTINDCAAGSTEACANVSQFPDGSYVVLLPFLNLSSLEISGIDIEADYSTRIGEGRLSLRALANYQGKYKTQAPGLAATNIAGDLGSEQFTSNAKWQGSLSATYSLKRMSAFLQARFIGPGKYNALWTEGVQIDDNSVPAIVYLDTTLSYKLGGEDKSGTEIFLTVNNLLNKAPPLIPIQIGSATLNTNYRVYDLVGRYFTVGARFSF